MVWNMRNGVIAVTRDGTRRGDERRGLPDLRPARPAARYRPALHRGAQGPPRRRRASSSGAFELSHLPNRAELRLKSTGRSSATRSRRCATTRGRDIGAALFFKDLTRVEQLEERERLRDRLAALGEMAAGIAHEVKNPLAGIEVMAGLLQRQLPDSPDAQSLLADIIKRSQAGQRDRRSRCSSSCGRSGCRSSASTLADVVREAITMAESHVPRGRGRGRGRRRRRTCRRSRAIRTSLRQVFTNLLTNAFEALGGTGLVADQRRSSCRSKRTRRPAATTQPVPMILVDVTDDGPGIRPSDATGSSVRSSRPSRRAPGSGSPSSGRSSTRTTGGSTSARTRSGARGSASRCRSAARHELVQVDGLFR